MAIGVPASTSQTPGAINLASLTQYVLNFTRTPADSDNKEVVRREINAGIDMVNSRNWKKVYRLHNITLVADDADYSLPADYKDPFGMWRRNSSSERDGYLAYMDFQTFIRQFSSATASGSPSHYTIDYDQRLYLLSFPPTSSWVTTYPTLQARYHRNLPHLVAASDVVDVPTAFSSVIQDFARMKWAEITAPDRVQMAAASFERRWRQLIKDDLATDSDLNTEVWYG